MFARNNRKLLHKKILKRNDQKNKNNYLLNYSNHTNHTPCPSSALKNETKENQSEFCSDLSVHLMLTKPLRKSFQRCSAFFFTSGIQNCKQSTKNLYKGSQNTPHVFLCPRAAPAQPFTSGEQQISGL